MSYIKRSEPKIVTIDQVSNRLNVLEDTNTKLAQWLRLKIKQIDELDNKVSNNLADVELRKTVQKLSDDFSAIQNTTINNKTIDVMINSKMDTINKNVKGFSELIENKLINKITKLEEHCNSKFKILESLNTRLASLELDMEKVPTVEELTNFSKQFSDRLDTFESKLKDLEESVENRVSILHKKFSDELPVIDDIKQLDQGLCEKFNKIENYVVNLNLQIKNEFNGIKSTISHIQEELHSLDSNYTDPNTLIAEAMDNIYSSGEIVRDEKSIQEDTPKAPSEYSPIQSSESSNSPVSEETNVTESVEVETESSQPVVEKVEVINEEEWEIQQPKRKNKKKSKGKGK